MNGGVIVSGFCIGSALVGLWVVVRFPSLGPKRPKTVLAAVLTTMLALQPVGSIFAFVTQRWTELGPAVGLVFVVFPALTATFWAAACGMRFVATLRRHY
jgi:hypothetical protein